MAIVDDKDQKERAEDESADSLDLSAVPSELEVPGQLALGAAKGDNAFDVEERGAAGTLGAAKYVHAAFFAVGILAAFLCSKMLGGAWTHLAEWPAAVRSVPQLVAFSKNSATPTAWWVGP